MPLPTKPYREWREKELTELLEPDPAEESARLDFKKECDLLNPAPKAQAKAQRDLLVDIASMANAGGGALLIGVDENRRKNSPPVANTIPGVPKEDVKKLSEKISGLVDNHLKVRPPRPRITSVPVPGNPDKCVLIVEVQQNTYSLSMVTLQDLNQFWHRRGWDNRRMTTDEIQHAFDQMARLRRSAEDELELIRIRITGGVHEPAAWIAIIPFKRERDHIPTDPERLKAAMEARPHWKRVLGEESSPHECYRSDFYEPFVRGMCVKKEGGFYCPGLVAEIHRDGTVILREPAWDPLRPTEDKKRHLHLRRVYGTWLSGLCLFRDLGEHFGFPPVALAAVGCLNFKGCKLWWQERQGEPATLPEDSVALDPILLSEDYEPQTALRTWAGELANWWGKSQPIACPPWLTTGSTAGDWRMLD